jgi:hypothetical protein
MGIGGCMSHITLCHSSINFLGIFRERLTIYVRKDRAPCHLGGLAAVNVRRAKRPVGRFEVWGVDVTLLKAYKQKMGAYY